MRDHWFPLDDSARSHVPVKLWSWLAETGSLTERVKAACGHAFSLVVIAERDGSLDAEDAMAMGLVSGAPARIREVELRCGDAAWISARSVLPRSTLAGAGRSLASLGTRPLGDALFAHPAMTRGPIEVVCREGEPPLWGRRSVFRLDGEPLVVSEFFLPGLTECAR
ncbi:MAG: chorismate lyase [Gammaproteobacteria bacterium]